MKNLVTIKINRIFTFGCSFTDYAWGTWANILGYEFPDAKFYNFGKSGAGNHYIFNTLMQADSSYNFTHEDLVIVQWTNISREDRFLDAEPTADPSFTAGGQWITPGNIYSQGTYDESWVKKYFSEYGALLRDLAFIKSAYEMLRHKTQWHFIQMNDLVHYVDQWDTKISIDPKYAVEGIQVQRIEHLRAMYSETINQLLPSFYDTLFNNNWEQKFEADRKLVNKNFQDGHPHPLEHYDYLKRIFKHNWSKTTNKKVGEIQQKWIKYMDGASRTNKRFSLYQTEERWRQMVRNELVIRPSHDIDFRIHR